MGVMGITVEAVGVVVPLGRRHLGEAELVLKHLHVLEQRLVWAWWVHGARWVHGAPIFITSARGGARLVEGGEREGALVALGVAVDAAVHEHLVDDDLHRDLRVVRGEEVDLARLEPLLALVLLGVGLAAHSRRRLLARPAHTRGHGRHTRSPPSHLPDP
eukprot:scaffold6978_cov64-Phaeocystis_antarctica.AAC.11